MKIARSDPLLFRSEEDRVLVIAGSEGDVLDYVKDLRPRS